MLPVLLTEPFFLRVPLREGVAPWFRAEEREDERWWTSPSRTEEPRVRASKSSSNLPRRERSYEAGAGEEPAKSVAPTWTCEELPYPRLRWLGSSTCGTGWYEAEGVTGRCIAIWGGLQARCPGVDGPWRDINKKAFAGETQRRKCRSAANNPGRAVLWLAVTCGVALRGTAEGPRSRGLEARIQSLADQDSLDTSWLVARRMPPIWCVCLSRQLSRRVRRQQHSKTAGRIKAGGAGFAALTRS